MVLEGRPPVTNLYSSAIFIGWGAWCSGSSWNAFTAWASAASWRRWPVSSPCSSPTTSRLGGDTMEMMRAVLDTNFWLATHVVVITLGYAATFVAGLLAIFYISWASSRRC